VKFQSKPSLLLSELSLATIDKAIKRWSTPSTFSVKFYMTCKGGVTISLENESVSLPLRLISRIFTVGGIPTALSFLVAYYSWPVQSKPVYVANISVIVV
jgi:hypothetical protein